VSGLTNAFGCRAVVMGGGLVTAVVYILTLYAPSLNIMMITYGVIGGVSTGCTYIASLIIIAEYFDKKRGVATGITMAGSGVGSFVFPPLISAIISSSDWKFTFAICACIILQTCVCGAFLTPLNSLSSSSSSSSSKSKKKPLELKNMKQPEPVSGENDDPNATKFVQTYYGSVYSLTNQDEDLPCHQRNACLRITLGILKEMTDFKLLFQNMGFLLITISNFFLFTGYFAPFLYIVKIATTNGIDYNQASFLLSIIGK
jgi:MFS family permease